jgi:hypothetical protein
MVRFLRSKRKFQSKQSILILTVVFAASLAAQEAPQRPLYVIDLAPFVPQGATPDVNGTVAFLTNRILAVGMCFKAVCNLETFKLENGNALQLGQMNRTAHYHAILRSGDGGVLLGGVRIGKEKGSVLFDQELHTSRWIPTVAGVSVLGEKIPEGAGRLLAHTANLAAYLDQETVRIQSIDGELLGYFEVGKSSPTITFLGKDRILFEEHGRPEIREFNGTVLRTLKKPDRALGERTRQSEDGSRLLYDSFTRHVGLTRAIMEDALVVPSAGMSTDGFVPNGEMVRVIDTKSGTRCFEWYGKQKLLPPFIDHADIDPSGRLVAIMAKGTLTIFSLPDTCITK